MAAVVKNEENLKQNMHLLYTVEMLLCDSTMEHKTKVHEDYPEIKCTRNTLKQLKVIKHFMYLNGSEELIRSCLQSACFG